ncbi:hypothetical protein ACFJIX_03275 [Roseateles sp. UC29_93]|uniref:hypothetical protein n=1 Tax=Roseateles sp. UC29_93 TaxID=3350177 RepID=UPI00366E40D8
MTTSQTVRQHKGRTYVLDTHGPGSGPWRGRFVVKGEEDGRPGVTAWHELDDEFPSADEAVEHADRVACQYIATFAEQA